MSSVFHSGCFRGISYTVQQHNKEYDVLVNIKPNCKERTFARPENAEKWIEFVINNNIGTYDEDTNDTVD